MEQINKNIKFFCFLIGLAFGTTIYIFISMFSSPKNIVEASRREEVKKITVEDMKHRNSLITRIDTLNDIFFNLCEEREFNYYKDKEGYVPQSGFIPDESTAVRVCMPILQKIYGNDVFDDMPISICLSSNGIWKLNGHVKYGSCGGSFYMEIDKKSGKVLKVLHGK